MPDGITKLNVSYVGMITAQVDITDSPMFIELKNADNQLDEVVVTAFGMKRDRKGLGYAVQDLKAEDLNTAGTTSLSSALQGKLSGVDIRPSSGAPGASSNITIRGVRSFSGNNAPLYVVDGMPIASTPDFVNTANSIVTGSNVSDRSIDINPDDIESINVLKGQAAAALYGIRASNGVIVITTKRGSADSSRPVITISTDLSAERISRKFKHQDVYSQGLSPDESTLICPAGQMMKVTRREEAYTRSGFRSDITVMTCDHCDCCPFKDKCVLPKNKYKEIHRKLGNIREERKAKARLDLPANRQKLKRRSLEPEPVFAQLKHNHGYTRFRHFGKAKVTMDLGFIFMALNILKLHKNIRKSA